MTNLFITFLQLARGHCQGLRPRRPISSLETDSQQSSRWASPDSSLFHCPQVITCAAVWDKTWRQSEGHSSSRLPDEHAYASPWAKDDSTRFKVITEAPRGQLTTNLRLVCSFWWAKSFNKTNSSKHRRTSRVADLNDSENVGSSASSQQRPTTHTPFPTPHFSGSQLSVCYVCGVCGVDTLKPHMISDVARLEWSLGICIPRKHSRNWMAGPQAMFWKTLMCLQYVTKHCYCLWLHGKFYAKESIQIIVTETAHYTNLSAIT